MEFQLKKLPPRGKPLEEVPKPIGGKIAPEPFYRSNSTKENINLKSNKVVPSPMNKEMLNSERMIDYMKSISSSEKETDFLILNTKLKRSKSHNGPRNPQQKNKSKKEERVATLDSNLDSENPVELFYKKDHSFINNLLVLDYKKQPEYESDRDFSIPQSTLTADKRSTIRMNKLNLEFKTTQLLTPADSHDNS
jgi:hypothetical protein